MPIEFRCDECDHLLRTPDEAAGKKARCPSCKNIQDVPSSQAPLAATPAIKPFEPVVTPSQPQPTDSPISAPANPFAAAAPLSNPYAAPTSRTGSTRELALAKVRIPAIILLVLSIISLLVWGLAILGLIVNIAEEGWQDDDLWPFIMVAASIVFGLVVIAGTIQMMRLKSHGFTVAAMVIAIAPITCQVCVTFPFAI
ncbi:MAG: hypothetical protein CMJ64_18915 [Planctomycetaceae bacterium]|nr:hypothetical protein [Planctomycetaceae bacterium]